jgi:3D (Asp-Asp-Asp) domain-containing protein
MGTTVAVPLVVFGPLLAFGALVSGASPVSAAPGALAIAGHSMSGTALFAPAGSSSPSTMLHPRDRQFAHATGIAASALRAVDLASYIAMETTPATDPTAGETSASDPTSGDPAASDPTGSTAPTDAGSAPTGTPDLPTIPVRPVAVVSAAAGAVVPFGDAPAEGQPTDISTANAGTLAVVGLARTPTGLGYWTVTASGGVFSFGDAGFYGSLGSVTLNKPIVGIAATPDGGGYWLVSSDGGVFAFGDAGFYGSLGSTVLNAPIVGMVPTPDGQGYLLAAADGGVFAFGDADYSGSLGGKTLQAPVIGIASTPDGQGYWLAGSDGGVFAFGDAGFYGSLDSIGVSATISAITASPSGDGYWLAGQSGGVYSFGDAPYEGSISTAGSHVVGLIPSADGVGYWEETASVLPSANGVTADATSDIPAGMNPAGNFVITCYDLTGHTASGTPAGAGEIAVDPSVIPLGTTVYIQGVGTRVAEDTGGAIRGNRIDLWEPTASACSAWGVESREVYK